MNILLHNPLWLIEVLVLIAVLGFYKHFGIQPGHPIAFGTVCSFLFIHLLWSWKNKDGLINRCILAAPFSFLLTIIFKVVGFETMFSVYAGIATFLLLIIHTDNCRLHFFITLMTAVVFTILFAFLRHGDISVFKACIISGIALPFVVFFVAYIGELDSKKTLEVHSLLTKSIKLSGLLLVSLTLFLVSHNMCRHYRLGAMIPFMISCSIALGFIGICHWFKLGLSGSSANDKNNEIETKELKDRLKMRSFVFGGKDKKNAKTGKCEFCGRVLRNSEVSHAIKGHTFCGHCYSTIENEKTRMT